MEEYLSSRVKRTVIGFAACGCIHFTINALKPAPRLYDESYNDVRKKKGILPLPEDWITSEYSNGTKEWFAPNRDTLTDVYRSSKTVVVKKGEIDYEEDHIVKHGDVLSICSYYDDRDKAFIYNDDTITKPKADSILQVWKFK